MFPEDFERFQCIPGDLKAMSRARQCTRPGATRLVSAEALCEQAEAKAEL